MELGRRDFLYLSAIASAISAASETVSAQAPQAGPKLVEILRTDLEGQRQVVQETVVSVVEFGPGSAAPWHMHPGAQELLYVMDGALTIEVEGRATTVLKPGEISAIPAEAVHLARNESSSANAKALVIHSRSAKDKPLVMVVRK
jgi:quercetin dioxygenase-like cupin family protein